MTFFMLSVRHICRQAHLTASDLLRESEIARKNGQYKTVDELEAAAKELSKSRTTLRNAIQLESLLDNTPLGELVRIENSTGSVTADSIFTVPLGGNLTIGSLVIRAGANAILEGIKKWPGFSLMGTQQQTPQQVQQQPSYQQTSSGNINVGSGSRRVTANSRDGQTPGMVVPNTSPRRGLTDTPPPPPPPPMIQSAAPTALLPQRFGNVSNNYVSSNGSVGSIGSSGRGSNSVSGSSTSPGRSRSRSPTFSRGRAPGLAQQYQSAGTGSVRSSTPTRHRSPSAGARRSNSAPRSRGRDDEDASVASSHAASINSRSVMSASIRSFNAGNSFQGGNFGNSGGGNFGGPINVNGQGWDVDAVQEVRTRGAAAFAEGEELLKALTALNEISALAHTKLLLRLVGFCGDLVKLRTMAEFSGRINEAQRLAMLCSCVEATVDADTLDPTVFGGRSRKRLDNCRDLLIQTQELMSSLQRLAAESHAVRDFSGQQQLELLAAEISKAKQAQDLATREFSIVQTSHHEDSYWDSHLEDRLSAEGSEFITADFLLKYVDAYEGQSVGSLAIIAGAGAILTDIRRHWVGLTALGGGDSNSSKDEYNATSSSYSKDSLSADGSISNSESETWNPLADKINFSDARTLRILGFSIQELKAAGFSDIDILVSYLT
jgi:hypothetical protein